MSLLYAAAPADEPSPLLRRVVPSYCLFSPCLRPCCLGKSILTRWRRSRLLSRRARPRSRRPSPRRLRQYVCPSTCVFSAPHPILTAHTEDESPQDEEGHRCQVNQQLHHDSSYTCNILFPSAFVAGLFLMAMVRSVEALCLPAELHTRFSRWARFCEIAKAHACWTRQFWYWYLMFGCSAFG